MNNTASDAAERHRQPPTRLDIEARQLWQQYEDMGAARYSNRDRLIGRFAIWRCAIRLGIDRLLQAEDKEGMIADDMEEYGRLIAPEAKDPLSGGYFTIRREEPEKTDKWHVSEALPNHFRDTINPSEKTVNVTIPSDLPTDLLGAVLSQYFNLYGIPTLVFNKGDNKG